MISRGDAREPDVGR